MGTNIDWRVNRNGNNLFLFRWNSTTQPSFMIGRLRFVRLVHKGNRESISMHFRRGLLFRRVLFISSTLIGVGPLTLRRDDVTGKWRVKRKNR